MEGRARPGRWRLFVALSYAWLAVLCLLYWLKPDWAAALTIFPAWTWIPLGLVPLLWWRAMGREWRYGLLLAWLVYAFAYCEEWISLVRLIDPKRGPYRVVSLNCAGGSIEAAEEVIALDPDIVLLQESPSRPDLEKLLAQLYRGTGSLVSGPDGSILCRWKLEPYPLPRQASNFVAALCHTPEGPLNIVSLRLMPPSFRVDLFSPSAWSEVAENRRLRRQELAEIVRFVGTGTPVVFGGDFNAQSGDAVFRVMPDVWKDSFYEAGRGWCHTAVNDYPLARIDQIWIHEEMVAKSQLVLKTVNSDHRMVVLDFGIARGY